MTPTERKETTPHVGGSFPKKVAPERCHSRGTSRQSRRRTQGGRCARAAVGSTEPTTPHRD
jgi:hypothetical protein